MPRGGTGIVDKSIGGQKLTQHAFRRRLIEAVQARGLEGACVEEIIADFNDPSWALSENRYLISNTLTNLMRRGVFIRISRGRYVVDEDHLRKRGSTILSELEFQIISTLKDYGGFATYRQILVSFGIENDLVAQKQLIRAMEGSELIRQDYIGVPEAPKRLWNLRVDLISQLPLRGRWLKLLHYSWMNARPKWDDDFAEASIAEDFFRIGIAFERAADCLGKSCNDLFINDDFSDFMEEFSSKILTKEVKAVEFSDRYDLKRGKTALSLRSEGMSDAEIIDHKAQAIQESVSNLKNQVWTKFTEGDPAIHIAAPLDFYYLAAEVLECEPVHLSRGLIVAAFND